MANNTKHFNVHEFACKCGCGVKMILTSALSIWPKLSAKLSAFPSELIQVVDVSNGIEFKKALMARFILKASPLICLVLSVLRNFFSLLRNYFSTANLKI